MPIFNMTNRFLAIGLIVFGSMGSAHAVSYNVVGGELIGAFDVDVAGTFYDVIFGDGSCVSLYSGCDELSDFPFSDPAESQVAAMALITQVFGNSDVYDADPSLTRGCESNACFLMMPYVFSTNVNFPGYASVKGGSNTPALMENVVVFSIIEPSFDLSAYSTWTYTQWTPTVSAVPVPAAIWLFGTALIGFIGFGKRKEKLAA